MNPASEFTIVIATGEMYLEEDGVRYDIEPEMLKSETLGEVRMKAMGLWREPKKQNRSASEMYKQQKRR